MKHGTHLRSFSEKQLMLNVIKATLSKSTGEQVIINIPETGREISLSKSLDFEFETVALMEFIKNNPETYKQDEVTYLTLICKCLNAVYGDLVDFFELDSDHINTDQAHEAIVGIYNLTHKALSEVKPTLRNQEQKEFIYNGETFVFPVSWKDKIRSQEQFKSPSVRQAIEVLQIQTNYQNAVKDLESNNPEIAAWVYEKYLTEIAILLLKPEEKIPIGETEFKEFINSRTDFFKDIDLQSAVDIEHWFNQYYESLRVDKENHYYFNGNNDNPENAEELKSMQKAKLKNEEVFRRIGFKGLIRKLLDIGAFSGSGKTDLEAVNEAPFTDAVKLISIDNSQ